MERPRHAYVYHARVARVVDGDTFDADVDLGFGLKSFMRLRLRGVDSPEPRGASRPEGLEATAYARLALEGKDVLIETRKSDAFGRYLARVWVGTEDFAELLLDDGMAVPMGE